MKFKTWLENYKGEHEAPDHENGAPLHNLSGVYPDDIYGPNAARYYGDGTRWDYESIAIIQRAKNRPNMGVKVYRAIPKVITPHDKINDYEQQLRYILKTGKVPKNINTPFNSSQYYDRLRQEIEKLKTQISPEVKAEKITINSGDWVSINRGYAIEHGKDNVKQYKIISKTVPARTLFTDGNSIHEWGYVPNSY